MTNKVFWEESRVLYPPDISEFTALELREYLIHEAEKIIEESRKAELRLKAIMRKLEREGK